MGGDYCGRCRQGCIFFSSFHAEETVCRGFRKAYNPVWPDMPQQFRIDLGDSEIDTTACNVGHTFPDDRFCYDCAYQDEDWWVGLWLEISDDPYWYENPTHFRYRVQVAFTGQVHGTQFASPEFALGQWCDCGFDGSGRQPLTVIAGGDSGFPPLPEEIFVWPIG